MGGSGISWTICKSAPSSRQITTPAPHHSVFTGRMPFLPPNQQRQSTEGTTILTLKKFSHGKSIVLSFNKTRRQWKSLTTLTTIAVPSICSLLHVRRPQRSNSLSSISSTTRCYSCATVDQISTDSASRGLSAELIYCQLHFLLCTATLLCANCMWFSFPSF